ncbi:MAG: 50S ribosomal protein L24 [Patescibacteria group bacterium]
MHVKKNDTVIILTGKDKGKTGKILRAFPREDKVLVEGVNIKKVHRRAKKSGGKGEIIEKAYPVHVSNVRKSSK